MSLTNNQRQVVSSFLVGITDKDIECAESLLSLSSGPEDVESANVMDDNYRRADARGIHTRFDNTEDQDTPYTNTGHEEYPTRITAKKLVKLWGVQCEHQLYSCTGDWYHSLNAFPGVLFDKGGFIKFETKEQYEGCTELKINPLASKGRGLCTVKKPGISSIPGYTVIIL